MSAKEITQDNIDAILLFLAIFETEGFEFGQWEDHEGEFPCCWLSPDAEAFVEALYENGWVEDFDWPSWQKEAVESVDSPEALATADLETLRKLLTLHVRKDRYCDGHLVWAFECGHLIEVLSRLKQIRESGSPP